VMEPPRIGRFDFLLLRHGRPATRERARHVPTPIAYSLAQVVNWLALRLYRFLHRLLFSCCLIYSDVDRYACCMPPAWSPTKQNRSSAIFKGKKMAYICQKRWQACMLVQLLQYTVHFLNNVSRGRHLIVFTGCTQLIDPHIRSTAIARKLPQPQRTNN
jgi:hypothetical protein